MIEMGKSNITYSDQEIEEIKKRAEAGDAESMYVLMHFNYRAASINRSDGAAISYWRTKALDAGHPAVQFEVESILKTERQISLDKYEKLAEVAAIKHGGMDYPYFLALGYSHVAPIPYGFEVFPVNSQKALYWMVLAAERGNVAAAEHLCTANYFGNEKFFGVIANYEEARRWCTFAAVANCSIKSGYELSRLFINALGGAPRNTIDARYWFRIYDAKSRLN